MLSIIKEWFWKQMKLSGRLDSGIRFSLLDSAEWLVFLDIFVKGEYQEAFCRMEKGQRQTFRVLDLGANGGFFMLYAADWARRRGCKLEIWCVEPSEKHCRRIRKRAKEIAGTDIVIHVVQGCAGLKSGKGYFEARPFHLASKVESEEGRGRVEVDFVDLSALGDGKFDLIKADIEGFEKSLVECYPELLKACGVFVVEIHDPVKDLKVIAESCHASGLVCEDNPRRETGGEVWTFFNSGTYL